MSLSGPVSAKQARPRQACIQPGWFFLSHVRPPRKACTRMLRHIPTFPHVCFAHLQASLHLGEVCMAPMHVLIVTPSHEPKPTSPPNLQRSRPQHGASCSPHVMSNMAPTSSPEAPAQPTYFPIFHAWAASFVSSPMLAADSARRFILSTNQLADLSHLH